MVEIRQFIAVDNEVVEVAGSFLPLNIKFLFTHNTHTQYYTEHEAN